MALARGAVQGFALAPGVAEGAGSAGEEVDGGLKFHDFEALDKGLERFACV